MTTVHSILFFILLVSLIGVRSEARLCTKANIERCLLPLKKFDYMEGTIVPSFPEETMRKLCKTYAPVRECMREFEHTCDVLNRRWFEGIHASYKYLCDDHFEEYVKSRDCLAKPLLHEEGKACNWTIHYSFSSDSYLSGDTTYKAKRICQYAKTYLSCVEALVDSFCGKKVASWQRGLDEASLHPLLSYIGCPIKSSGFERKIIIIGITVTFVMVVIFVLAGICMWIYGKKKESRHRRQNRWTFNNGAGGSQPEGSAVYRVGAHPAIVPEVTLSPYEYITPSPVPPPYAEKPPAYDDGESTGLGAAGGGSPTDGNPSNFLATGMATAFPEDLATGGVDQKLPPPPDYESTDWSDGMGGATAGATSFDKPDHAGRKN